MFDREVHQKGKLSPEQKFEYRLESIKEKSPAYDVVTNYRGVRNAYELAYRDFIQRFGTEKKLSETLVVSRCSRNDQN